MISKSVEEYDKKMKVYFKNEMDIKAKISEDLIQKQNCEISDLNSKIGGLNDKIKSLEASTRDQ